MSDIIERIENTAKTLGVRFVIQYVNIATQYSPFNESIGRSTAQPGWYLYATTSVRQSLGECLDQSFYGVTLQEAFDSYLDKSASAANEQLIEAEEALNRMRETAGVYKKLIGPQDAHL